MKRLGLTLGAALCLAATTFAAGNQPTTAKWEGNINDLHFLVAEFGHGVKLVAKRREIGRASCRERV